MWRRVALAIMLFGIGCERAPTPASSSAAPPAASSAAPPPGLGAPASAARAHPPAPARGPRSVDRKALARLRDEAQKTGSDALIVLQDGRIVTESTRDDRPIESMSITKSVLALLVGCLIDRGKLTLDRPVHELFPNWSGERQEKLSVLHLLTHSSGIAEGTSTRPIYASRSFVDDALRAPIDHEPGTHYEYGNRAANLLAGVIARAAGMPVDTFARRCLFEPLGITRFAWSHDRAGNAHGLAGLQLLPRDLARIGELVLGEGEWNGRRVISRQLVLRLTREPAQVQPPHKRLALLWWLVPAWTERTIDANIIASWREAGVEPELIDQIRPLAGKPYRSTLELVAALRKQTGDPKLARFDEAIWKKQLADARYTFGPLVGTSAQGSLGQWLVVVPEQRLVAVRMRRAPKNPAERSEIEKAFPDFPDRVLGLIGSWR